MFRRLLVPLDGSKVAESVLPYAEEIAAKFGAEIILVSVSEYTAANTGHLYRSYLEWIAKEVERRIKDWGAPKEASVASKALTGEPADEILRYADEGNVNLIVMASRGSSGGRPWPMGNIAWKVLQAAGKPVLLIRAPASTVALEQKRLVKRILLPLDGSEMGEMVIPHVEALAGALGAEVILLHILEIPAAGALVSGTQLANMSSTPEAEERRVASALRYLDGLEKALGERGLSTSSVINSGSAADEIIRYAQKNAVDLIAMSTHGRSGIGRWVFGSVTQKVLHAGNTAVLTVRAKRA